MTHAATEGEFWLEIAAATSRTPESLTGTVTLAATDAHGAVIETDWPMAVNYVADLTVEPDFLHLGAIEVGHPEAVSFNIVSRSGRELQPVQGEARNEKNVVTECNVVGHILRLTATPLEAGACGFDVALMEKPVEGEILIQEVVTLHFGGEAYLGFSKK